MTGTANVEEPTEAEEPTGDEAAPGVVEVVASGVDAEGDVVVDDLIAAVDGEGHVVATDETILIKTPQGDVVVDEIFSVAGEDGELHAVEEDVTVLEVEAAKE